MPRGPCHAPVDARAGFAARMHVHPGQFPNRPSAMSDSPPAGAPGAPHYVTLADGRRLAYSEWGVPDGWPLVVLHGLPGSRLQYPHDLATEQRHGARVITLDRPGLGLSDRRDGRRFADFPADLEQLLDRLGIGEFGLVGISGGGPYSMATAIAMPARVRRLHLASPMGPLAAPQSRRNMCLPIRGVFFTGRYAPWLLRSAIPVIHAVMSRSRSRGGILKKAFLPPADRSIHDMEKYRVVLHADFCESARRSGAGVFQEVRNLVVPWDIDPADVAVPTTLWHGDADTIVPVSLGRYLAGRIPGCHAEFYPELGHFFIFDRLDEVLALMAPGAPAR